MTHLVCGTVMVVSLLAGVGSGWGQQFVYVPKTVSAEEKVQKTDGVLVQEVSVRKGDTLYGISRTFSGHGSYYPQILLFNDLKDPNRIYPGNVLKIPVSRRGAAVPAGTARISSQAADTPPAAPVADAPVAPMKKADTAGDKNRTVRNKAAVTASAPKQPAAAVTANPEQRLYERAIKSYRQENYRAALDLFDRFLAEYPSSALAADASLYKAECYLKLSSQ